MLKVMVLPVAAPLRSTPSLVKVRAISLEAKATELVSLPPPRVAPPTVLAVAVSLVILALMSAEMSNLNCAVARPSEALLRWNRTQRSE